MTDTDGNPLSELALVNGAWVSVRDYVWLDGKPLAQLEYPGPSGSAPGYAYYFHLDQIGLPRALTNSAGQTVWSAAYRPYGDIAETTTADSITGRAIVTNVRLPGQYDERLFGPLGLQGPRYNWNRWYLPGVGRYLEPDPIAMRGGCNLAYGVEWYGYASQNPLLWTDPEGLRIYTDYGEAPGQFGPPPCGKKGWAYFFLPPGEPPSACEPSKCGDEAWGFDAHVSVLAMREFLNEEVMNQRENPHDIWSSLSMRTSI